MKWSSVIPSLLFILCSCTSTQAEVTCLLGPTAHVTKTKPEGKNVFRPGESVEVVCSENHWLYGLRTKSQIIRCKESGQWEQTPVCEAITCEMPYNQHVTSVYYYFSGDRRLGVSKSYFCERGYRATARSATCTEDGWFPKPLCTEIGCRAPTINNTKTLENLRPIYKPGERIEYECLPGYEPERLVITCDQDERWRNLRPCTEVTCLLGPTAHGTKTKPEGKTVFRPGESVEVICSENHWLYRLRTKSQRIRCKESGQWEHTPVCEAITCEMPYNQHVTSVYYYFSGDRRLGVSKSYFCERGYRATARSATCTEDGWSPKPLCTEIGCRAPTINNTKTLENLRPIYKPGERIEYECLPGYEPERLVITCDQDERWRNLRPCTEMCGQPPSIAHAVYDIKEQYKDGEIATYDCPSYYIKDGDSHMTCRQGKWIGNVRCLEPCTVDVHIMEVHNIQLSHGRRQKMYIKHGDSVHFACQGSHKQKGNVSFHQQCKNGRITVPVCE